MGFLGPSSFTRYMPPTRLSHSHARCLQQEKQHCPNKRRVRHTTSLPADTKKRRRNGSHHAASREGTSSLSCSTSLTVSVPSRNRRYACRHLFKPQTIQTHAQMSWRTTHLSLALEHKVFTSDSKVPPADAFEDRLSDLVNVDSALPLASMAASGMFCTPSPALRFARSHIANSASSAARH